MTVTRRQTDDQAFNQFQDETISQFRDLSSSIGAIANGQQIDNVSVSAGQVTNVPHNLGGQHSGVIVVRADADVRVWETDRRPGSIQLSASGSATVSLWVY